MARVKRGFKRKRRVNKLKDMASGFVLGRSSQYRQMKQTLDRSLVYAYRDRRVRKRDFRMLWIARLNAAARENFISYSRLIAALKSSGVFLNRKVLSEIAINDPSAFTAIVDQVRDKAPAV